MKRLLIAVLVIAAAWYGWKKYPEIVARQPGHEAVVVNNTGRTMERVRFMVDHQTFVKERLDDGASAKFAFRVANDTDLGVSWQWADAPGEFTWHGGMVPKGPMVQRHTLTIDGPNEIVYQATHKTGTPAQ
jgi:hypothetical protein